MNKNDIKPYKRHIYIINKKFQLKYVMIILAIMLFTVFSVSFTTFYVIWNSVIDEFFFVPEASKKLADIFIRTSELLVLPVVMLGVIYSVLGILFSHKIAGPLYRVQKISEEISRGNLDVKCRFRKDDELQELADSLNGVIGGIKSIVSEDRRIIGRLTEISEKLEQDVKKNRGLKKDVKESIGKLSRVVKSLKASTSRFKI